MNARESLAADREADDRFTRLAAAVEQDSDDVPNEDVIAFALVCIAAELRAARIYANYLEGREQSRTSEKRKAAAWTP